MNNETVKRTLMTPLEEQSEFENLLKWKQGDPEVAIVYFTAKWCGPCRSVQLEKIIRSSSDKIKWYVCDIDDNEYTAGYCSISKIPSWLAIVRGKHQPALTGVVDHNRVIDWAAELVRVGMGK